MVILAVRRRAKHGPCYPSYHSPSQPFGYSTEKDVPSTAYPDRLYFRERERRRGGQYSTPLGCVEEGIISERHEPPCVTLSVDRHDFDARALMKRTYRLGNSVLRESDR